MKKIGIYGGTFSPVHKEHIEIAKNAIEELGLDKLIILPAGIPPHKDNQDVIDKNFRLDMCKIAFTGDKMEVNDYEIKKEGKSYTVDTLEHFTAKGVKLYLIIGGDSLRDIHSWKEPERIFKLAKVVTIGRKRRVLDPFVRKYIKKVIKLKYDPEEISSTEIRVRNQFGFDIDDYVTRDIEKYIAKNKLYSEYRNMLKKVEKAMNKDRFAHTMRTTVCGVKLASQNGVNYQKAFIACALHDVAKCLKDVSKYQKDLELERVFLPPAVIHAFVGSYIAEDDFCIEDRDILLAIKYHTTGAPDMTTLQKIVYVADCIESGRDYKGVKNLRKQTQESFEKGFLACLNSSYEKVKSKQVCPLTTTAVKFYAESMDI